ncbi:MAG TPA: hypothetical protein VHG33_03145 [Woeseiaceae bacterium]|nr:hypothetical protein [Woeseiaceae bacterium]
MDFLNGDSGIPMTVFALLAIAVIFASALWFIISASSANKKFRWFQIVRTRAKRKHLKSVK